MVAPIPASGSCSVATMASGSADGSASGASADLRATDVVDDQVEVTVLDAVEGFGAEAGRGQDLDVVALGLEELSVDLGDGDRPR